MKRFLSGDSWRFTVNLLLAVVMLMGAVSPGWGEGTDAQRAPGVVSPVGSDIANDGLYAYDDGEHVQAATSYRGNSYGYDANGNMTSRVVDDVSYILTYDEENRLISVTGGVTVTFTYDGDGNRVRKEVGGVVTHYPGRHYEAALGSGFTKYYFADGQLVTLERSPEYGDAYGRRYVFRDHLGSTSIIVNGQGVGLWEDRYLPFGDVRYHSDTVTNTVQTRYRYTGQWLEEGLAASPENGLDRGLYLYEARWYDANLGRFVQPDTIVPEPGNPQALNRYTYVNNNSIRSNDPNGHCGPLTPLCLALGLAGMGLLIQDDVQTPGEAPPSQESINSQKLGGALMVAGGGLAVGSLALGVGTAGAAGETAAAACADGDCTDEARAVGTTLNTVGKVAPSLEKTAFEVARSGGRHAGLLRSYAQRSTGEITKAAESLQTRANEHLAKLADPTKYANGWTQMTERQQQGLLTYWQKEALNYQEQADVLLGILNSLGRQ